MPYGDGTFVGRVWLPECSGPALVTIRNGQLKDITSAAAPTMRDLMEHPDPVAYVRAAQGNWLGPVEAFLERTADINVTHLLAPIDLQAIKACGVTFARSMVERVIEERSAGNAALAHDIRQRVSAVVGDSLKNIKPGSPQAATVKAELIKVGLWSQYLEVGIGPDAEVFTKAQPMSSVGQGADVGLHPASSWNNPEPEMVLVVDSAGTVKGATLGNDVNLRDIEGRSALLLGKAKDNNASCSIGPFIRLFDENYGIGDVRSADVALRVEGTDGFVLNGLSSMTEISRDPLDLVSQAAGRHHQYPDGFVLFMGTLFAPIEYRDVSGQGFTHKRDDIVTISNARLGSLRNRVRHSTECAPWSFGTSHLMRNLVSRGLL